MNVSQEDIKQTNVVIQGKQARISYYALETQIFFMIGCIWYVPLMRPTHNQYNCFIYFISTVSVDRRGIGRNFNYSECKTSCDQPHWCAICFEFGHNARSHRHGSPLQNVSLREIRWYFGGWSNPLIMMYDNIELLQFNKEETKYPLKHITN